MDSMRSSVFGLKHFVTGRVGRGTVTPIFESPPIDFSVWTAGMERGLLTMHSPNGLQTKNSEPARLHVQSLWETIPFIRKRR